MLILTFFLSAYKLSEDPWLEKNYYHDPDPSRILSKFSVVTKFRVDKSGRYLVKNCTSVVHCRSVFISSPNIWPSP